MAFILLIPPFGKEGAAIAMVIGNLFVPAYLYIKAQKLYFIPYRFGRILLITLAQGTLFVGAAFAFTTLWMHVFTILAIGCLLVFFYYHIAKKSGIIESMRHDDETAGLAVIKE